MAEPIAEKLKKGNQRMKPYLVYNYLMRNTDSNHVASATTIVAYLQEFGISAERRSIYKDIEEINKVFLLTTKDRYGGFIAKSIEHATQLIENEEYRAIVYDEHRKGFYVNKRNYKVEDVRFLAECIYAAKFIDERRAKKLVNVVCDLVSEHHASSIKRDAFLLDRVKTENDEIFKMVSLISIAMSRKRNKQDHIPEKIKFKYTTHTIQGGIKLIERRHGDWYIVSPFKLLISDDNYYLIGYDDKMKKIVNFRIDRMKDLELTGDPRCGEKEFESINIETYLQEHFGMFSGEREHIVVRAINPLLDTFVDRFGKKDVIYAKDDNNHFTAVIHVAVSDQFFGWLCGLGNKVKIISPSPVVERFKNYLDKMRGMYD